LILNELVVQWCCCPRGVNRPPLDGSPSRSQPVSYPVGRTVPIRGVNRRDSLLSRGENRLNY
jgi:hypothetical protein